MVLSNMCDGKQGQDQNQLYDIPGRLQDQLHEGLPWKTSKKRCCERRGWFCHDYTLLSGSPRVLCNEFYKITDFHDRVTRKSSANELYVSTVKTSYMQRLLGYYGTNLWNRIPMNIKETDSIITFKKLYNNFITSCD